MKDTKNIEIRSDLPVEKSTTFDLSVSEFNEDTAYLEFPEELDKKMVSYIEREVRNSYEYRDYISYLKNELNLNSCSLLPGININEDKVSLEFHHYPLNLFEIVECVGNKMIANCNEGEKISCFDIAEQVTKEHYLNNIGLVPLTETLHEMAHSRSIIIPMSKVNGNYKAFMKKYAEYISEDIKERVATAELENDTDESKVYNTVKLEKNISHYNITYKKDSDDGDTTSETVGG